MSWGAVIGGVATLAGTALSGSSSKSKSKQTSEVFDAQRYRDLYSGASRAASMIDPTQLQATASGLLSQGGEFLSTLTQAAQGGSFAGNYFKDQITNSDGLVEDQIALLQSDLGRFFGESILPQIQSQAVGSGQLGGGRQGVAQGAAITGLGQEFTRGVLDIRAGERQRRDALAAELGNVEGRQLDAANMGLAGLSSLYNLEQQRTMAPLGPFAALADILGSPTVLGSGSSASRSSSWTWGGIPQQQVTTKPQGS